MSVSIQVQLPLDKGFLFSSKRDPNVVYLNNIGEGGWLRIDMKHKAFSLHKGSDDIAAALPPGTKIIIEVD